MAVGTHREHPARAAGRRPGGFHIPRASPKPASRRSSSGPGSSVGSLYHHFGGKSELFLALWQEHQLAHEQAASEAVAEARKTGVTDPGELFAAGARAFLQGSWQRRDLALLFLSGDGPPGFEVMQRQRSHEWVSQNDALLHLPDTAFGRLYASVLTSLIGEGAREVATSANRRQADKVIDAVLEYARRLMAGGPWKPAGAGTSGRDPRGGLTRGPRDSSPGRLDTGGPGRSSDQESAGRLTAARGPRPATRAGAPDM